jgi:hypothetical protein
MGDKEKRKWKNRRRRRKTWRLRSFGARREGWQENEKRKTKK